MPTIYVSDPIHDEVLAELRGFGDVHLGYGPDAVTYSDVCRSVDAVLLRGEKFTRAMIEASPRLRIIARHGVGTDNVDLDAADKAGVWVTNTPGANSRAVAEHVFALTLTLARKVTFAAGLPRSGLWRKGRADNLTGFELHGRTLGLLGLGNIGTLVAASARPSGCTCWSPTRRPGLPRSRPSADARWSSTSCSRARTWSACTSRSSPRRGTSSAPASSRG